MPGALSVQLWTGGRSASASRRRSQQAKLRKAGSVAKRSGGRGAKACASLDQLYVTVLQQWLKGRGVTTLQRKHRRNTNIQACKACISALAKTLLISLRFGSNRNGSAWRYVL